MRIRTRLRHHLSGTSLLCRSHSWLYWDHRCHTHRHRGWNKNWIASHNWNWNNDNRLNLRGETMRRLEPAFRILNWDDLQGSPCQRGGITTSASIIICANSKKVFVLDYSSMSRSLNLFHHEFIFRPIRLLNSIFCFPGLYCWSPYGSEV